MTSGLPLRPHGVPHGTSSMRGFLLLMVKILVNQEFALLAWKRLTWGAFHSDSTIATIATNFEYCVCHTVLVCLFCLVVVPQVGCPTGETPWECRIPSTLWIYVRVCTCLCSVSSVIVAVGFVCVVKHPHSIMFACLWVVLLLSLCDGDFQRFLDVVGHQSWSRVWWLFSFSFCCFNVASGCILLDRHSNIVIRNLCLGQFGYLPIVCIMSIVHILLCFSAFCVFDCVHSRPLVPITWATCIVWVHVVGKLASMQHLALACRTECKVT